MKILIITSCFAPKNVIGAVRISKITKYLVRKGHDVTVISPVLECYDGIDETLECEELKRIHRITIPYSKITTVLTAKHKQGGSARIGSTANQLNKSFKGRIYRTFRNLFAWWRDYEWALKAKLKISKLSGFDLVFSSYPNVSTHDAAWYALKAKKSKKWIADFRDPLALESVTGAEHKRQVQKQSDIVHHADRTVYVTQSGAANFICKPEDRYKVVWIPNGFDEEDFLKLGDSTSTGEIVRDTIVFSYAGGMYHGERDCSPLFRAIRELIDEKIIVNGQVRFEYAGADYSILRSQAEQYKLSDIVKNLGRISRTESLNMQRASDCVVVATFCYRDGEGAMPGKVYEPIMLSKPILMLVSGSGHDCEAARFVNQIGAGCSYQAADDNNDISMIKNYIITLINDKKDGVIQNKINSELLDQYRYQNIADRLLDIAGD